MRRVTCINQSWRFTGPDKEVRDVNVPHTWNAVDGQDGGNDYWRGSCLYTKEFEAPAWNPETEAVYLEFQGVNASALVALNGRRCVYHDGGYSTFRVNISELVQARNHLEVMVDNSVNDRVYPQKADFTFYGGIYRDVNIIVVNKMHFDLDYFGGPGLQIASEPEGEQARVNIISRNNAPEAQVLISILDTQHQEIATGRGSDATLYIDKVHLWDGLDDPYLYTAVLRLVADGQVVDEISSRFGVRNFCVDPEKGFYLNGRSYPLRGVSRHQDRKGIGNALTRAHHREDMELIREMGANAIRLAHYQHDQYFYDLCDECGMVVWAEIPYISSHMPNGRDNTIRQMKELIIQNYNHPSIVTWGVSNEITIVAKDKKDMLDNHRELNDLCHEMDPTRPTTLACYAACSPFNKSAHITDLVGWNLYLGWYTPWLFLNDLWIKLFHFCYPKRPLGFSEYGCEAMTNLHSPKPRRGDHTEEYQAVYHEYMLKCFERHPFMWGNYVWNMFDFAADARDQGGEPGMNHKGLVTFDRKIKKDSFYLYKAYWSQDGFVHIAGSRYVDRAEKITTVKVYSNQEEVTLYNNGVPVATKKSKCVFEFQVLLEKENELRAVAGGFEDTATIRRVAEPNSEYKLNKKSSNSANWI